MGVKGLAAFLRQKAPGGFVPAAAADVAGKRVGVDVAITLHKGAAMEHKYGPLAALETLAQELAWLLELGCRPVYVFDGVAPALKAEETERRRELRAGVQARLAAAEARLAEDPGDAEAREQADKLRRQCCSVTEETMRQARELLRALGVASVEAPGEAERALAHLQRAGRIDVIFTEDIDVLLCGASSYVKNYSLLRLPPWPAGTAATPERCAEVVRADAVLAGLGVSYEGLLTVGLLAGTDFAPKLPKMGPATAWKHVRQHGAELSACKALEAAGLLERYRQARLLLSFDERETGPSWSADEDEPPDLAGLEALFAALRQLGSLAVLRCHVERAAEARRRRAMAERPAKRKREGPWEAEETEPALGQPPARGGAPSPQDPECSARSPEAKLGSVDEKASPGLA